MTICRTTVAVGCLALLLTVLSTSASAVYNPNGEQPQATIIPGLVTVQFEDNVRLNNVSKAASGAPSFGVASFDAAMQQFDVAAYRAVFPYNNERPAVNSGMKDLSRFYELQFPEDIPVQDVVDALSQDPNVRMAEPVWAIPQLATPNDPLWSNQWAMEPPGPDPEFYNAWDIETGSMEIVVGVIDGGYNWTHSDLNSNTWVNPGEDIDGDGYVLDTDDINGIDDDGNGVIDDLIGYDFMTGIGEPVVPGEDGSAPDPDPNDFGGHGTHVSGIIAAMNNNLVDVTGAAGGWYGGHRSFGGVRIMALRAGASRASDGLGLLNSNNIATAMDYATMMGVDILNNSWGGGGSSTVIAAMNNAIANGVTVVKAAGNDNCDCPDGYTSAVPALLQVASTTSSDIRSGFSNFGIWVDVSAPGSSILSTYSFQYSPTTATLGGTSMASPMVAGLAALIKSMMPSLTRAQVDSIIIATTDNIDGINDPIYTGRLGSGRINAFTALSSLSNAKFTSDVTDGNVPLTVNFTDQSPNSPVSWIWDFGTGDSSIVQNPQFVYTEPGVYSVNLAIDDGHPLGMGEERLVNYIWAQADTLVFTTVEGGLGDIVEMPIYLNNTVPVKSVQLVFEFPNSIDVGFDTDSAFSVEGLRTEDFFDIDFNLASGFTKQYSLLLSSSGPGESTYLLPDTGAIVKLRFKIGASSAGGSVPIDTVTQLGTKKAFISTIYGDYWPITQAGEVVVNACDFGDANCDGSVKDPIDLAFMVNFLFDNGPTPDPVGGDCNMDTIVDPIDLACLTDFLFGP